MKNSHFIHLLNSKFNFSENTEKMIESRVQRFSFPKDTPLLRPGEVCSYIYFIEAGYIRQYTNQEEQQTTAFGCQGHLCTVLDSFFKQSKSKEGMICETEVVLYAMHYHDLMALEEQSMEFLLLSKKLLTHYFLCLNREKNVFLKGNAAAKFNHLCQHYPGLVAHIKHKDMASYLGIAQQSFSRLLKELLTKG